MAVEWLLERWTQWDERAAFIWAGREYSYGWLGAAVKGWQVELAGLAIRPGQVVAVYGDYSPSVCALLIALAASRTIVVPITSASPHNRTAFAAIAQVEVAFHFASDDSWSLMHENRQVTHHLLLALRSSGAPGLVLFSSGSTGASKAIVHDLDRLLEKFAQPRPAWRTIAFLLLDHIGGINTLFHTLATGGALITPEQRTPAGVLAAVQAYGAELLPTAPTFLNLLLISAEYERYDLSSLQVVTYGTEVMPERVLHRLNQILPNTTFRQTYGLSELGILRAKSRSRDSLWVKVGGDGYETKVVDGVLWIRGRSAMLGYLNAPSPFDQEGWFNTGDLVEEDGEYVRILGRASDLINVGGQKVYPTEVESAILLMENVADVTVYGERHPLTGQVVAARVVLVQPEEPASVRRRIRAHCAGRLEPYKIPAKLSIADTVEHDARFKKQRRL